MKMYWSKEKKHSIIYNDSKWGYVFIAPMLIGFILITILPIAATFIYSLTDKALLSRTTNFVGLDNYKNLFTDKVFIDTVLQTLEFTLLLIPANLILTLALAALLSKNFRGCGLFRTAVFTPVVTSVVVWGVLWKYMFQTDVGLLNSVIRMAGGDGIQWLFNTKLAIPISSFVTLVKGLGLNMVIFIGAMQNVPEVYYEAASLDGASRWDRFYHITLPSIAPSIFLVIIMTIIRSLKVFGQIQALTGGGPGTSSYVMVYYIYQEAFQNYRFGYASSASVMLFLIIVALTLLQWGFRKRWIYHEE